MQEKFDKSSIIGFVLIGLILMGYMWYASKKEQERVKNSPVVKTEQKVIADANAVTQKDAIKATDSTLAAVQTNQFNTKDLAVTLSNKGGQVEKVVFKNYKAYSPKTENDTDPLVIIDKTSRFNIELELKNGQKINTESLVFTPTVTDKSIQYVATSNGGTIQFNYNIQDDYSFDFHVQTENLDLKNAKVQWDNKVASIEKGRSYETTNTEFVYEYDNYKNWDYWTTKAFNEKEKIDWIATKQQFFSPVLWAKNGFMNGKGEPITLDEEVEPKYLKQFKFEGDLTLAGNNLNEQLSWHFFPLDYHLLKSYEGKHYDHILQFGWSIIGWLNKHFFINVYELLAKWGIAAGWIIFWMTIIVKLITSPIVYKQYKQSAMMRVIKPEMEELNAKHKDADPLKKQQAVMELYRKTGVNPFAGCLPALLQMPIFYALFKFFPNFIGLRDQSFLWADDLTAYDSIATLPFNIPMYGNHVSGFVLLYAASLLVYTRMTASNMQQPTQEGMPDMKWIMYLMPFMLIFFFNSFASGLSWYYFVSNTLSIIIILIIKQWILDEAKIHAKIQENKTRPQKEKKKGRFATILEKAAEQQRQQLEAKKKR